MPVIRAAVFVVSLLLARALDAADPDLIILQEFSLTLSRKHGNVAERLRDLPNGTALPAEAYGSAVAMAHGSRLIEAVGTHLTNVEERKGGVTVRDLQAGELVDRVLHAGDPARPGEDGFTALEGEVTDPAARATERIDCLFVRSAGPHRIALSAAHRTAR